MFSTPAKAVGFRWSAWYRFCLRRCSGKEQRLRHDRLRQKPLSLRRTAVSSDGSKGHRLLYAMDRGNQCKLPRAELSLMAEVGHHRLEEIVLPIETAFLSHARENPDCHRPAGIVDQHRGARQLTIRCGRTHFLMPTHSLMNVLESERESLLSICLCHKLTGVRRGGSLSRSSQRQYDKDRL